MFLKVKLPSPSVARVRIAELPVLTRVTCALRIRAPLESCTVPRIVPKVDCAASLLLVIDRMQQIGRSHKAICPRRRAGEQNPFIKTPFKRESLGEPKFCLFLFCIHFKCIACSRAGAAFFRLFLHRPPVVRRHGILGSLWCLP